MTFNWRKKEQPRTHYKHQYWCKNCYLGHVYSIELGTIKPKLIACPRCGCKKVAVPSEQPYLGV